MTAAATSDGDGVAYFAFGANTCSDVLVRRRGVRPLASEAAVLHDHRLAFVHRGVPWIEPAFASVLGEPGRSVHGVLHLLRAEDMERLDRSESGRYERQQRLVVGRTRGEVRAQLYLTRRPALGLSPSRRYRDLLVRGAREFESPASWIRELEDIPCSHVPVLSAAMPWIVDVLDVVRRRMGD